MFERLGKRKVILWGAGNGGNFTLGVLRYYSVILDLLFSFRIVYVVDNDYKKRQAKIFDLPIVMPQDVRWEEKPFCVIAVDDDGDIVDFLKQFHYAESLDYISYKRLDRETRIIAEIADQKDRLIKLLSKECAVTNIENTNSIDEYYAIYKKYIAQCDETTNKGLADIFILIILREYGLERSIMVKLEKFFPASRIAVALTVYCANNYESLTRGLNSHSFNVVNYPIRTIGIYYYRFYNGGVERFISLIIPIFLKLGYRVVFFSEMRADGEMEYDLPPTVPRISLPNMSNNPMERITELEKHIKKHNIDVMIYNGGYTDAYFILELLMLKVIGVRVVIELHNVFTGFVKILSRKLLTILRAADKVIVLSRVDQLFWSSLDISCLYIPNPISTPIVERPNKNYRNKERHILWIGRLEEYQKNINDIVPIMKRVVKKIPYAVMDIVGTTDHQEVLKRLIDNIERENLDKNIIFHGYHKNVERYYLNSEIMLVTSSFEGFPFTVGESKAFGLPLVTYDMPYLELLQNNQGYVPVPMRDTDAAADAIIKILEDDILRDKLSLEAYESIKQFQLYDIGLAWKNMFEEITDISTEYAPQKNAANIALSMLANEFLPFTSALPFRSDDK